MSAVFKRLDIAQSTGEIMKGSKKARQNDIRLNYYRGGNYSTAEPDTVSPSGLRSRLESQKTQSFSSFVQENSCL